MNWLIWSNEHKAWWRPGSAGYTPNRADAGHYSFSAALQIVQDANKHLSSDTPNETMCPCWPVIQPL